MTGLLRVGILVAVLSVVAVGFAVPGLAQSWTVELTKKQERSFRKLSAEKRHSAMAISPDGAWGTAFGKISAEVARNMAMRYCQGFLRVGKRNCFVYALNGKIVAPAVVKTEKVTAVYKPLDHKRAAGFFGLTAGNFAGNPKAALKDAKKLAKDETYPLKADRKLEALLRGKSLMSKRAPASVVWFSAKDGEQHMKAGSKILYNHFADWIATGDGLVCLMNNVWNTGKPIGNRCLILHRISNGSVELAWATKPNRILKAQIIVGDARFGAAR